MRFITNRFQCQRPVIVLLSSLLISGCVKISEPLEEPAAIPPSPTPPVISFATSTATPLVLQEMAVNAEMEQAMVAGEAPPEATATATPAPVIYRVEAGDTLSVIAKRHEISLAVLLAANNLTDADELSIGQELIIPSASQIVQTTAQQGTPIPTPKTESGDLIHFVQVGETLSMIASQYSIEKEDLLLANGLRPEVQLTAGDTLLIPQGEYTPVPTATAIPATPVPTVVIALQASATPVPATPTATATPAPSTYTVKAGDIAGTIAKAHGVSLEALAAANPGVRLDNLSIGQTLTLPGSVAASGSASAVAVAVEPSPTPTSAPPVVSTHEVQAGESLANIATMYGLSEDVVRAYNPEASAELGAGTVLQVPVTPTPIPSPTSVPTITPTPAPKYLAPSLLLPTSNSIWSHRPGKTPLQLVWTSTGVLNENEFYVVRLRAIDRSGTPLWAVSHWTQAPSWHVPDEQLASLEERVTLRWDVMVMRRTSPAGVEPQSGIALSEKSATYEINFLPPSR